MKSMNVKSEEESLIRPSTDYSVYYEDNSTKIKFKKVYKVEDESKREGFPKIIEHSETENKFQINDTNKNGEESNLDTKRRRSGNLNSSNEENSPKVRQEKKRTKIEERQKMFDEYYPWVLQTYGDAAKTKTITIKKLNRIINALNGKESNRPDSSKFRFWVKTKGFTTIKPENFIASSFDEADNLSKSEVTPLYVLQVADSGTQTYKQVAVVERFFDIIYYVHVSLGSKRCGRHAGQKRTYRTITETYAFLPREAVSKFLSLCMQCKKQQITENNSQKNVSMTNVSNYYDNRYLTSNLSDTTPIKHERNVLDYKIKSDWKEKSSNSGLVLPASDIDHTNRNLFKPYENNNNNKYSESAKENSERSIVPSTLNISETLTYYQLLNYFYQNLNLQHLGNSAKSESTEIPSNTISNKYSYVSKIINQEKDYEIKTDRKATMESEDRTNDSLNINFNEIKIPTPTKSWKNGSSKQSNIITSTPETNIKKEKVSKENGNEIVKQMTSTYLSMTRSLGLEDDDALNLDPVSSNANPPEQSDQSEANVPTDPYGNILKDTEKLKLMLLAWNYQNSAAVQNGTDGPDFATMSALWSQYQNALAITGDKTKINTTQADQFSTDDNPKSDTPDENNSSGQKEDDESEDESDDKLEQNPQDPERLKAFNMFVRLFVDENLDRMIPISKQPKEKVQAIIDSCTRQFPEFSERARKRIRTYLKSCRRNKRTRDGWENTTRPTPAHLTSVQAEQILAIACENESLNVKRMRVGLEPIGHGTDPNSMTLATNQSQVEHDTVTIPTPANIARISPISNGNNNSNNQNLIQNLTTHSNIKLQQPSSSNVTQLPRIITVENTSPVNYTIKPDTSRDLNKEQGASTPKNYHAIFANPTNTPTDLSLKRPVFPHKLSQSEILAVKQLITGYRESAAFLLRSADELEQLLQQQ